MNNLKMICKELHSFLILWSTQSLSLLGSSMTSFALILWTYEALHGAAAIASFIIFTPFMQNSK